jgi:hypothetical protein
MKINGGNMKKNILMVLSLLAINQTVSPDFKSKAALAGQAVIFTVSTAIGTLWANQSVINTIVQGNKVIEAGSASTSDTAVKIASLSEQVAKMAKIVAPEPKGWIASIGGDMASTFKGMIYGMICSSILGFGMKLLQGQSLQEKQALARMQALQAQQAAAANQNQKAAPSNHVAPKHRAFLHA